MNKNQKKVLLIAAIGVGIMMLCPPWKQTLDFKGLRKTEPLGYAWVLEPPKAKGQYWSANIDYARLTAQVAGLCVIVAALVLMLGQKNGREEGPAVPSVSDPSTQQNAAKDRVRPESRWQWSWWIIVIAWPIFLISRSFVRDFVRGLDASPDTKGTVAGLLSGASLLIGALIGHEIVRGVKRGIKSKEEPKAATEEPIAAERTNKTNPIALVLMIILTVAIVFFVFKPYWRTLLSSVAGN